MENQLFIAEETIAAKIYTIRDQKAMLYSGFSELYRVETKRLKEQVKEI